MSNTNLSRDDLTKPVDKNRRRFLLKAAQLLGGVGALCALSPFISSWRPTAKVKASGGPVTVDLSHLKPGQKITVEWRGKPVWIIRRTPLMLKELNAFRDLLRDPDSRVLQQPAYAHNSYRSIRPEYLVLIGLCTHLGCSPLFKPNVEKKSDHSLHNVSKKLFSDDQKGDLDNASLSKSFGSMPSGSESFTIAHDGSKPPGEFYCPCHGSRFDLAGRVYKGVPAPVNLEVPPYRFISDYIIEIGESV